MNEPLPSAWRELHRLVNDLPVLGAVGLRDPEGPCEMFDGKGYDGTGGCHSDGHWLCVECSQLSPRAPRFTEYEGGSAERLHTLWRTNRVRAAQARVTFIDPLAGEPYSLLDILEHLANAADHLLRDHDCDAHGHEIVKGARDRARAFIRDVRGCS